VVSKKAEKKNRDDHPYNSRSEENGRSLRKSHKWRVNTPCPCKNKLPLKGLKEKVNAFYANLARTFKISKIGDRWGKPYQGIQKGEGGDS